MSAMGLVTTLPGVDNTANLNLDFINQKYSVNGVSKNFNEVITFSRNSTATYFGSDGLLKTAGVNTPRFEFDPVTKANNGFLAEEARTNFLTYSEQFDNAAWAKAGSILVTPNATVAPDGTVSADKIITLTGVATASSSVVQTVAKAATPNTYTASVYAKAGEMDIIRLFMYGANTTTARCLANYNLSTGVTSALNQGSDGFNNATVSMTAVGGGWYRCTMTATTDSATTVGVRFYSMHTTIVTGDSVSGMYVWGAQLEAGLFATSYIPSQVGFTGRTSTATYLDSTGVLRTAAAGVARNGYSLNGSTWTPQGLVLEAAATNITTYSALNHASWTRGTGATWTDGQVFVDGTNTAILATGLTGSTITGTGTAMYRTLIPVTAASTYTFSVFAKLKTASTTGIRLRVQSNPSATNFNVDVPLITTDWTRASITVTIPAGDTSVVLLMGTATSPIDVYLGGVQLELGTYPTSYIPTPATFTSRSSVATYQDSAGVLQTAATNVARSDAYSYDSAGTLRPIGLLLETAAATNLQIYSEQFDNAAYSKSAATIVANSTAAPNSATTADKMVETVATGVHYLDYVYNGTFATGDTYTYSVFVKPAGRTFVRLNFYYAIGSSGGGNALFDLTNKAITFSGGVTTTQGMVTMANGWVRCWISGVVDTPAETRLLTRVLISDGTSGSSYTGDGTSGLYLWGSQLETGRNFTSYIPTVATSVTRSADVATSVAATRAADVSTSSTATRAKDAVSIETLTPWYNPSAGTISLNYTPLGPRTGSGFTASFSSGTNDYLGFCYQNTSATGAVGNTYWRNGGSGIISTFINGNFGARHKVVNAWSGTTLSTSADGATTVTGTSVTAIPTATKFELGDRLGAYPTSNYFSSVQFYARRLTDSMIQILSS
jgi:hypothetical protein